MTPKNYYGNGQYFCVDTTNDVQLDARAHYWLVFGAPSCPMNGGSSGGPNFIQLSDGSWAIIAVNNRVLRGPAPMAWGQVASNSWFDGEFLAFYDNVFATVRGAGTSAATAQGQIASD